MSALRSPLRQHHPPAFCGAIHWNRCPKGVLVLHIECNCNIFELVDTCPSLAMQELMKDPVFAVDGHTYERGEITTWFMRSDCSPMTGEPLPHTNLVPNLAMRSAILQMLAGS